MSIYTPIIATRGLQEWTEHGTTGTGTCSRHPMRAEDLTAPVLVDREELLRASDSPVTDIWREPSLDVGLPPGNVRHLMEGCIGVGGSTEGHPYDGTELRSCDSVGVDVWVKYQEAKGAKVTRRNEGEEGS